MGLKLFLTFVISFFIANYIGIACSNNGGNSSNDSPAANSCPSTIAATPPLSHETPYCTLRATFADPVTIQGRAQFNIRQSSGSGFGAEVLGGPIAWAEIQMLDNNGTIVQCGETDGSGNFSLLVPKNQTFTVSVNSRSLNSHLNASVLNAPGSDAYYPLTQTFSTSTSSTLNLGTLTAPATGTLLGGAFNILFNLLRANDSLRYFVPGFTVAPKVRAYWAKGVNPGVYINEESGISFYEVGTDQLFILGGEDGDVDSSDYDHFDDSVISHEYGHFIEDHYAKTDSPGGAHDGQSILDARLVWGEGWANFFSSAVRANKIYRDCYGTPLGVTGCFFNYDIDKNSNYGVPIDLASTNGEGNFHEFTVTRSLWDAIDPVRSISGGPTSGVNGGSNDDNSTDNVTQSFSNFWNTFTGPFQDGTSHFRNVGLFLELNNNSVINSSSVLPAQKVIPSRQDYGKPLPTNTGPGCAGSTISIFANDPSQCTIGGQVMCVRGNLHHCCSNQFASNDFYDVYYDGSFSTIKLIRTSGSAELNLYLYKDNYEFGNQCDMATTSDLGSSSTKTINLAGLPLGHYMLNVNVYTGNGNPTSPSYYQLYVNSNQVCP